MRYLNPGYKNWLTIGASSSITEVTDAAKTKTGVAFYNSSDYANYVQLDFPASGEIYCKFDFYYTSGRRCYIFIGEVTPSYSYNKLSMDIQGGTARFSLYAKRTYISAVLPDIYYLSCGIKPDAVNSALFHLKWATDSENGFMDLQINNFVFDRIESADLIPYSTAQLFFAISTYDHSPISNIIISDEPISIKEQIVSVPAGEIFTEMDFSDGLYTADSAGQTFLQSVDLNSLINEFGAASKVTGVAVVGNPAFRTGEGLSTFTAISKKGGVISEHTAANVPADSSVVQATFSLSDTTLADLQNIQLGLKVGG